MLSEIEDMDLWPLCALMLMENHSIEFNRIKKCVNNIVDSMKHSVSNIDIPHDSEEIENAVISAIGIGLKLATKKRNKMQSWISVEDNLPPDYQDVFYVAVNPMGHKEIMTGHRVNDEWTHCCLWYSTQVLNTDIEVTHWMELPLTP